MKFNTYIKETSLSRIRKHTIDHDCGIITSCRNTIMIDGYKTKITKAQNIKRNKRLLPELLRKYNVTSLRGVYIENYGTKDAVEVGENVFFVVDIHDKGQLESDLFRLGKKWNQDSVLFIQKNYEGILISTTKNLESMPYKSRRLLKNPVFGKSGEIMTKVLGKPFILNGILSEHIAADRCMFSQWPLALASNMDWK